MNIDLGTLARKLASPSASSQITYTGPPPASSMFVPLEQAGRYPQDGETEERKLISLVSDDSDSPLSNRIRMLVSIPPLKLFARASMISKRARNDKLKMLAAKGAVTVASKAGEAAGIPLSKEVGEVAGKALDQYFDALAAKAEDEKRNYYYSNQISPFPYELLVQSCELIDHNKKKHNYYCIRTYRRPDGFSNVSRRELQARFGIHLEKMSASYPITECTSVSWKRWSDFKDLHTVIAHFLPQSLFQQKELDPLPKGLPGLFWNHSKPQYGEKRVRALNAYLVLLNNIPQTPEVREALEQFIWESIGKSPLDFHVKQNIAREQYKKEQ